jgi:hypothetical protein
VFFIVIQIFAHLLQHETATETALARKRREPIQRHTSCYRTDTC